MSRQIPSIRKTYINGLKNCPVKHNNEGVFFGKAKVRENFKFKNFVLNFLLPYKICCLSNQERGKIKESLCLSLI